MQRTSLDDSKRSTFPHYLHCTLTQRLFCCCEYAGSPTAVVQEVAPAMDIPAMLCTQPARSHYRKQEDVERDLGLAHRGISTSFSDQRRLPEGNKRLKEISTKLTAARVYRFLGGSRFPTGVWWLAKMHADDLLVELEETYGQEEGQGFREYREHSTTLRRGTRFSGSGARLRRNRRGFRRCWIRMSCPTSSQN